MKYAPISFKLDQLNLQNISGFVSSDFQRNTEESAGLVFDANAMSFAKSNFRVTHANSYLKGAALWFEDVPAAGVSFVDSELSIFGIFVKTHGSSGTVAGFKPEFVKNGAITSVTTIKIDGDYVYSFEEDFYHDFQVFDVNMKLTIPGIFSLFKTNGEYHSFTNVTIKGVLNISGPGSGGLFLPRISKMTVHIVNSVVNMPTTFFP